MNRYHRQILLPQIGAAGQDRLGKSRVLLVGCGALGTVIAEQMVRAGIGMLRIVDRDIVELTNLQRQVLFDERDAAEQMPKAIAAARRLGQINSDIAIEPIVADVHPGNVEDLAGLSGDRAKVDLIVDGTDNSETRYLLNDVSVKHRMPWVYGACVGMTGRAMAFVPPTGPCLRCIFPTPPSPGELLTCDTMGVFSPVAAMVASLQSAAAIRLRATDPSIAHTLAPTLETIELWENRFRSIDARDAKRGDCIACGNGRFDFLEQSAGSASTSLCGRNAVQVRPAVRGSIVELGALAIKLSNAGRTTQTAHLVRCELTDPPALKLTVFADGRGIVEGTSDLDRAKSIYSRYIGA